jgi:hypothetical protein
MDDRSDNSGAKGGALMYYPIRTALFDALRRRIVTSKKVRGGRRYRPYAFTGQGVAMLSSVLSSDGAVLVSDAESVEDNSRA